MSAATRADAPARDDFDTVAFWVWQSLGYRRRMALAFAAIAAGIVMQLASTQFAPGIFAVIAGNLLLLVRGYDNRVDFSAYAPDAEWCPAPIERLVEIMSLERRARTWDVTLLDATNLLGLVIFVTVLVIGIVALAFVSAQAGCLDWNCTPPILGIDMLVLLVPHWLTGIRKVVLLPKLVLKARTLHALLRRNSSALSGLGRELMAAVRTRRDGGERVPEDLKLRIDVPDHHEDFLGVYVQVVLNDVQGTSYPYLYAVLVAREGYGLVEACDAIPPPPRPPKTAKGLFASLMPGPEPLIRESSRRAKVEVVVLRQHTTRTSGYHTDDAAQDRVLAEALRLARAVAVRGDGAPGT